MISFEEKWFQAHAAKHSIGRAPRFKPLGEIQNLCDKGALPLYSGARSSSARSRRLMKRTLVWLPKSCWKIYPARFPRLMRCGWCLSQLALKPDDIDFVISCSEEAVGDRYNRGGGNLAEGDRRRCRLRQCLGLRCQSVLRRADVRHGSGREHDSIRRGEKSRSGGRRIVGQTRHEI